MSASADRNPRGQRRRLRLQPRLEGLEDRRLLSTFKVNTTLDTVAVDLKKGKDASGHISLRSAIEAANAKGGNNKIILPGGTLSTGQNVSISGLPVVGFMVYNVVNANAQPGVLGNYGGVFAHRGALTCHDIAGLPCPTVVN